MCPKVHENPDKRPFFACFCCHYLRNEKSPLPKSRNIPLVGGFLAPQGGLTPLRKLGGAKKISFWPLPRPQLSRYIATRTKRTHLRPKKAPKPPFLVFFWTKMGVQNRICPKLPHTLRSKKACFGPILGGGGPKFGI